MAGKARQQRIGAEMQRVLAELISREVRDPRVGMVTLTAVQVAPDLSVARVLFVPFGGRQEIAEVQEGLARAAGYLRGEVGRRLSLRHHNFLQAHLLYIECRLHPMNHRRRIHPKHHR